MSTQPGQREQYLVINVMGQETTSLASLLTRLCTEHRCQIVSSRMSRHGSCAVLLLQVSGNWDALARLETPYRSVPLSRSKTPRIEEWKARGR